jgi:Phage tail protein (Tail_P2_I)
MTYPFDPAMRQYVADLLYNLLPSLYQIRDLPEGATDALKTAAPPGTEELYKFLNVLAAPLAEIRENVDELHADFFIDKCADWVLPYLAQMVGMKLVFPDAQSNRVDVRGTIAWRRRKGTPAMLQEMGSELSGQMVVTQEGFKRILLSQDYNLLRLTRAIPRIGPAILAEQATGPLDATFHAVDSRRISLNTGRYHPKHVTHWVHPTQLFPLREGTANDRTQLGDADLRYVFDPLRIERQLRIRRATPDDVVPTDRVPVMHFASRPGDYFDQDGTSNARFTVRIDGLPGGVAAPGAELRAASAVIAEEAIVGDTVAVTVLEQTSDRLTSSVDVEVFAVPLTGAVPDTAAAQVRGGARISAAGAVALPTGNTAVASPYTAMLRLRAVAPETAAHFPGATIEIAGAAIDARLGTTDAGLAVLGFLSGALVVSVPATWVWNERWFFLAADGSIYDAQSPAAAQVGAAADLMLQGGGLPGEALTVGPGPAWPPLPRTATPDRWRNMPSAVSRGPIVMHGAPALLRVGASFTSVGVGVAMGLVFAMLTKDGYLPFLRLDWTGGDPTSAVGFSVLTPAATPIGSGSGIQKWFGSIAKAVEKDGDAVELHVRLEADVDAIVLPPCEVAYTSATGDALLIHLPQLETGAAGLVTWSPSLVSVSDPVSVSADGSTYMPHTLEVARYAYGSVAPIREAASHRRRRVRQRSLCPWNNEDVVHKLPPTPAGYLDIDPLHGLFALALAEPAPAYTTSIEWTSQVLPPPAQVTVDYQDGYSHHVGARPDAREPILDFQQPTPTRLVLGAGRFHRGAPSTWHAIPRYATLSDALADIASGLSSDEVVQIDDSSTYVEPTLSWPSNVETLTIQAAEFERPVLILGSGWGGFMPPKYTALTLRGLVLDTNGFSIDFARADRIDVQFCTVTKAAGLLHFTVDAGTESEIHVQRSITGRIQVDGEGMLSIVDSVVDGASGKAISAPDGTVELTRVTVVAKPEDLGVGEPGTLVRVLEASESLFTDRVVALDRFHGCIRYSRVAPGSQLPRRHRVVEDEPSFVMRDRNDPAHLRLSETCPRAVLRGAEDGSEMGAFHDVRLAQRGEALLRRLIEYTPAGLATGILRLD